MVLLVTNDINKSGSLIGGNDPVDEIHALPFFVTFRFRITVPESLNQPKKVNFKG